jgi:hypothetical protein
MKSTTKRPNENPPEQQQQQEPVKRIRLSSRPADDTSTTNSNRIVLRIRKPSEDLTSSRSETSNSSSSSGNPQVTVQIKEPLRIVKEDDENQIESQSMDESDNSNQASIPPPKEDEQ